MAKRAFALMGPVEAFMGMAAFVVSLMVSGWHPGESFPRGAALATASGATFAAVVIGQMANGFACRSTTRWPGSLGWFSNRLLVGAVLIELAITAGFLFVPPIARVLGHSPPSLAGWVVALAAGPAVILTDAAYKAVLRRRRRAE